MDRLYIFQFQNSSKTHLGYFRDDGEFVMACFPSRILVAGSCGDEIDVDREAAEYWDSFFNEVNCPTCLKWARGKDIKSEEQLVLRIE